jgi:hypothetical protein
LVCTSFGHGFRFKSIKFDTPIENLIDIGIKCDLEKDSFITNSCGILNSKKQEYTLFGQNTRISIMSSGGKVSAIGVGVEVPPDKLIEQFTSSIGPPLINNYISLSGYNINQYYWVSRNGTSINITKNLDEDQAVSTLKVVGTVYRLKKSSTAKYLNKAETSKLLKHVTPPLKKGDY